MVAVGIDGEAFARAFVMLELFPVRDIQSQVLTVVVWAVVGDPVTCCTLVLLKALGVTC
jgi:hypothetical protein